MLLLASIITISAIILTMMMALIMSGQIQLDLLKIKLCLTKLHPDSEEYDVEEIQRIRDSIKFKKVEPVKSHLKILDDLIQEEKLIKQLRQSIKSANVQESKLLIDKIESLQKKL